MDDARYRHSREYQKLIVEAEKRWDNTGPRPLKDDGSEFETPEEYANFLWITRRKFAGD
jgi:hypothetical protein